MDHRHAAILAADVAQYSRFMEHDSEATVAALKSCRARFRECVSAHGGREFGSVGDSLMAAFPSAVEALRAARDCHRQFAQLEPLNDAGDRLRLRIALHAGDVIDDGRNVFGDAVNIAARLQEIARPGGIVLSAAVHEQVRNEPGLGFRPLGQQPLKHIGAPVKTFEVVDKPGTFSLRRWAIWLRRHLVATGAVSGAILAGVAVYIVDPPPIQNGISVPPLNPNAIAVLPFESLDTDGSDSDFLARGFYDNLLTSLAKVQGLTVRAPQIPEQGEQTLLEIATKVDAANVLSGTVLRNGDRVRVSVQMILLPDNEVTWRETYERDLTVGNLFDMQSDVARDVAETLQLGLRSGRQGRPRSSPTDNLEAYEEYVLGVQRQSTRTPADLRRAEQHFRRAIEIDPNFALAYVGLAETLGMRRFHDRYFVDDVWDQRRALIEKALELDPECARAYNVLGYIDSELGNYEVAEQSFRKAIELDPNDFHIVYWFGQHWYFRRQYEKALEYYRRAIRLAPDEPVLRIVEYGALSCLGRYQEALDALMTGVRQHPEFPNFYWRIDEWYARVGAMGEALRWAEAGRFVAADNPRTSILFCRRHLALRNYDLAAQCLDHVRDTFGETLVEEYLQVAFARSRFDEARALLEGRQPIPDAQEKLLKIRTLPENIGGGRGAPPIGSIDAAKYWLALGDTAHAKATLRSAEPTLFDDDGEIRRDFTLDVAPPIVVEDLHIEDKVKVTYVVAAILYRSGDVDRANALFDPLLEVLRASRQIERHLDDPGRWVGAINEIPIHAVRQDREMLLETVRDSLDELAFRWFAEEGPLFDFVRHDREWIELMDAISARVASEREYYEQHKEEPLVDMR